MIAFSGLFFIVASTIPAIAAATCISSGDQTTVNNALSAGGAGAIVQLCQNTVLSVTGQINFAADNQEISTQGYPTGTTRATIKVAKGSTASTIIYGNSHNGVRIMNLQLDGDRPNNGMTTGGGANIEIGGLSSSQVVSHVASRNPRDFSCLHVIGSGNDAQPCTNATIINNDIGPCGQAGTNAQGQGMWADGISFDCTNGLVSNNTITGSTDGGIVIFGSPGTTVKGNTITSSTTDRGFGGINMVDNLYQGSYKNVVVSNNRITGQKLFDVGIAVGAFIWSFNGNSFLKGPATITGNTFAGNIPFPIAVNGWTNGLTVTGNDVSKVNKPNSNFADDVGCSSALQTVFNQNSSLVYYPLGLTGSFSLQKEFIQAAQNTTNFICPTPPLPSSATFGLQTVFPAPDTGPFVTLHGGIIAQYQGDNNLVVLNTTGSYVAEWASGHTIPAPGCNGLCTLIFQGDGNLVTYYNSMPQFASGTAGVGNTVVFLDVAAWVEILDASGKIVWTTLNSK